MSRSESPTVSAIVPVYNDPSGLRATLDTLVSQTYPAESYEVVVVDNGSTDETPTVARRAEKANPEIVRAVRETDVQGSYAARNAGIRESEGDVLAFVDADVRVDRDWIAAGVRAIRERNVEYVGCRVDVPRSDRTLAGLYDSSIGFPVERYVTENEFAPTCALFVCREVFHELGSFDESLASGGDVEFGQRVAASGRELHYASDIRVEHPARTSLRSLLGKHVRIGRGNEQRRYRYPDRYDRSPLYHPIWFLPPHPVRFPEHFGDAWGTLSAAEKVGVYGVGYLQRLSRTAGRIEERIGGDRDRAIGESATVESRSSDR